AGSQPGRVEVLSPLGARLAEGVLELDCLVTHGAERGQRAGDVGGQLLADAPELRRDGDLLPGGRARRRSQENRSGGRAAAPEDFATGGVAHERRSYLRGVSAGKRPRRETRPPDRGQAPFRSIAPDLPR